MTHSIKLVGLASLFLFLGSCSSDDSTAPKPDHPDGLDQYLLTSLDYTFYNVESDASGNHTSQTPRSQVHYTFNYKDFHRLDSITRDTHTFDNQGAVTTAVQHALAFELNEKFKLTTLNILLHGNVQQSYRFSYDKDLLQHFQIVNQGKPWLRHDLIYNTNKLFTQASVSILEQEERKLDVQYNYNQNNELLQVSTENYAATFTYGTGKNPFYFLPFDLTTLLFEDLLYVPITYQFPHPLASYKVSDDTTLTFEYSYNKGNYPEKATVYKGAKTKANRYMVIEYNYHILSIM